MKRFVFAAIFAVCFVFLYSCGDDDDDSSITRLQSHLDGRLDNIEGEIGTLREDVNTLAAEAKTPLSDGSIPPDTRKDPDAVRADTRGLPPSGQPTGQPLGEGLPPIDVPIIGGGKIVYVVGTKNDDELYEINGNGTDMRLIAKWNDGRVSHPALAPDGASIAYTVGAGHPSPIFVRRAGEGEFQLTRWEGLYPAWSPDGNQMAFVDGLNIFISPVVEIAPVVQLTWVSSNEMPTWSPDGMQIAFVSGLDGNDNIFVMDVDGSNRIRVTNNPAADRHPDWSPDGRQIAFQSHRDGSWDIFLVTLNTYVETQITSDPGEHKEPSWSPDGTKLAFGSRQDIYTINADGTGLTNLTGPYSGNATSPDWQ